MLARWRSSCSLTIMPKSIHTLHINWKICYWHLFPLILSVQRAGHYFSAKLFRWPLALWTIFRIKRDILAAAHDVAKINGSQRANVRLGTKHVSAPRQCVERKQPPPQDTLLPTHSTSDLCFFFPPSIQSLTHAWFTSRLKSMCGCSPKSALFFFQECHVWVMAYKNAFYY